MAGVDLTTAKELAGHASISTTMRYAHLSPDHKARAVELLCSGAQRIQNAYILMQTSFPLLVTPWDSIAGVGFEPTTFGL